MEGLANMWEFDENTGNEVVNLINSNNGLLVGMSDADRVFGYKRKALSFDDDGGHLVVRGYKGIQETYQGLFPCGSKPVTKMEALFLGVILQMEEFGILVWRMAD